MDEPDRKNDSVFLGPAIAVGAGVGTALFAGSDNPVWIGLGSGLGVLLWAIWRSRGTNGP